MAKAKLSDVAREAGVSMMTVSRVLNGRGGASSETSERIRQVAEQLNYRPNALARALKSDHSGIIGVVVPDISNPFFPEIIRGAENVAMRHGYNLILCNVIESADRESDLMRILETQRVDGVMLCSARLPEKALLQALKQYKAAVVINRSVPSSYAGSITIDYRQGAHEAVRHLWDAGRRKIGILAGPELSHGAAQRLDGIRAFFASVGGVETETVYCDPDVAGGRNGIEAMLARGTQLDALICYNDLNAAGALKACQARGISVPKQIAIVGFDGIPLSELMTPTLSTVFVDKYSIGQLGMRMLLDRLDGKFTQQNIVMSPELIIRESSAY